MNIYHLVMAAVASDTEIDSQRYASMPFGYRIVGMDSSPMAAVNLNSYSIHLNVFPATAVRLASAADSKVAVDCNLCNYYFPLTPAASERNEKKMI